MARHGHDSAAAFATSLRSISGHFVKLTFAPFADAGYLPAAGVFFTTVATRAMGRLDSRQRFAQAGDPRGWGRTPDGRLLPHIWNWQFQSSHA